MEKKILFIGLDVDDKNFNAYAIFDGETMGHAFKTRPNAALLCTSSNHLTGWFDDVP